MPKSIYTVRGMCQAPVSALGVVKTDGYLFFLVAGLSEKADDRQEDASKSGYISVERILVWWVARWVAENNRLYRLPTLGIWRTQYP